LFFISENNSLSTDPHLSVYYGITSFSANQDVRRDIFDV